MDKLNEKRNQILQKIKDFKIGESLNNQLLLLEDITKNISKTQKIIDQVLFVC